jgi:hypothetical protein
MGSTSSQPISRDADGDWTTLTVGPDDPIQKDPQNNFALSVYNVAPGDQLDIRDLGLFLGVFPPFARPSIQAINTWSPSLGERVLYVDDMAHAHEGALVYDPNGQMRGLRSGELVIDGESRQLWQIGPYDYAEPLSAPPTTQLTITNLGGWSAQARVFSGLPVTQNDGRWDIKTSAFAPLNLNARLDQGTADNPAPYFVCSPDPTAAQLDLLTDETGRFVRVRALRDIPYLVLTAQAPLSTLDNSLVSLVGQIRAAPGLRALLTLHDVDDASGESQIGTSQTTTTGGWQTLGISGMSVSFPSSGDNYFIGLAAVHAGDVFDVRELSLYNGALPGRRQSVDRVPGTAATAAGQADRP